MRKSLLRFAPSLAGIWMPLRQGSRGRGGRQGSVYRVGCPSRRFAANSCQESSDDADCTILFVNFYILRCLYCSNLTIICTTGSILVLHYHTIRLLQFHAAIPCLYQLESLQDLNQLFGPSGFCARRLRKEPGRIGPELWVTLNPKPRVHPFLKTKGGA